MANSYIDFSCTQQDLARSDEKRVAEGASVLYARFDLCEKWNGLNLYARFQHMQEVYDVSIVDGAARVPHEIVKPTGFYVSVFGEDAEGGRLTSTRYFVETDPTISYDGAPPIPPTPSLLQAFEAKVQACLDAASSAADSAEEAAGAAAASIEIGTVTAGSEPGVYNSGDEHNAVLNFVLQKGDKGDPGDPADIQECAAAAAELVNVPSNVSDFNNDAGYLTEATLMTSKVLADYAKTSDVQKKLALCLKEVPAEYVTETELTAKGYLTEHQDLSEYAKIDDIPTTTGVLENDSGFAYERQLPSYTKRFDGWCRTDGEYPVLIDSEVFVDAMELIIDGTTYSGEAEYHWSDKYDYDSYYIGNLYPIDGDESDNNGDAYAVLLTLDSEFEYIYHPLIFAKVESGDHTVSLSYTLNGVERTVIDNEEKPFWEHETHQLCDTEYMDSLVTETELTAKGYQTEAQVNTLINTALGVIENGTY